MTHQPQVERAQNGARCPECGETIQPGGRGLGRVFCCKEHRLKFNARMKARGSVLAPYEMAAAQTRHAKKGSREAEVSRFARAEITAICSDWNEEDADAGRPPMWQYVESLMASGTKYCDRARR